MSIQAALKAHRIYCAPRSSRAFSSATNAFKAALKGPQSVRRSRRKRAMFSISVAKYRPHRPHRLECGRLQGFLAVGTKHHLPTAKDHYRPLAEVPPAYRPRANVLFSGCSMPLVTTAVDAVDTLRVRSRWFVLLGEARLCVYPCAGTISMYLTSDYIYPYGRVGVSCSQRRIPRRGRSRQQHPPTPSLRIPKAADDRHPAGGPSHRLGHLTPTLQRLS
jgi:hypothetical protein